MKSFFLGYGDETPGSVEPSGEHAPCLRENLFYLSENIDFSHKRGIIILGLFIIIKHTIYI